MKKSNFDTWYNSHEWWNSETEEFFLTKWKELRFLGMCDEDISIFLDGIVNVMSNEYGD